MDFDPYLIRERSHQMYSIHSQHYMIGAAYFVRDGNHRLSVARYHGVMYIDAGAVELRGQVRTDRAQRTGRMVENTTHQPQHPPEPATPRLHDLWQRLRPAHVQPGAQRVM